MPYRRAIPTLLITLSSTASCATLGSTSTARPAYTIVESQNGGFLHLDQLSAAVADADVVFFGEHHGDRVTHRVQLSLSEGLGRHRGRILLALEMFGRDVQPIIDAYLAGAISEAEFLRDSRPWTNYARDYRPLVELARRRQWEVAGTNLPQSLAGLIARQGIEALDGLPPDERSLAAATHECPPDAYWERFVQALVTDTDTVAHAPVSPDDPMLRTIFEAQCARDEAMAETVARLADRGTLIFHLNGGFHTDYGLGILPRLARRRPDLDIRLITAIDVPDPSNPPLDEHRDKADFIIFTRQ